MTENMKNFLKKVSEDKALAEKIGKLDKAELIALAKEMGIVLTEEDFKAREGELNEDELDAVAGGSECACAVGGGGTADGDCPACACVVAGLGNDEKGYCRCVCPVGGYGKHQFG